MTTPDSAALTELLEPEFQVLRTLGQGSTGAVYLARETALRRLVALKVPRTALAKDDVVRARFVREARAAARISHPSAAAMHRIGRLPDGTPFLVMEYIEGRTLAECLDAEGPFDPDTGRGILAQLAGALAAAHEHGVMHRDVRPGNVIWNARAGRAVLTDFGIAGILETGVERVTRITRMGERLGDLKFSSPEQLRADEVTPATDVYAFGMLAYHLLSGAGPYPGTRATDLVRAHLKQAPRPLRDLVPAVDEKLSDLLLRCLAKEPSRRPDPAWIRDALTEGEAPRPAPARSQSDDSLLPEVVRGFLRDLKRRRVGRFLLGYAGLGFAVLAVGELIVQPVSGEVYKALLATYIAGFPVALVLAWIYDVTTRGIRRTEAGPSPGSEVARTVLRVAGLLLSLLVAVGLAWLVLHL